MTDKLGSVSFECTHCGSSDIEIPKNNVPDAHMLVCNGCGAKVARWGDVKSYLLENAAKAARKAFSNVRGFK